MPENWILQLLAEWVQDIARFCTTVKPALFTIADFILVVVGLVAIVLVIVRAHRRAQS